MIANIFVRKTTPWMRFWMRINDYIFWVQNEIVRFNQK